MKVAGRMARNLGIDTNAQIVPGDLEFSLDDMKVLILESADLLLNYAFCGDQNVC